MNPLRLHEELTGAYRKFVESSQRFKNADIEAWVDQRIDEEQFLWRDPLLTMRRRYQYGPELGELVAGGHLHDIVLTSFTTKPGDPSAPVVRPYLHQTDAITLVTGSAPRNVVLATGTGSGKSFAFGIPIVSEARKAVDSGVKGIKAVIVYPMNALANSQYEDFAARLAGSGLTLANYTGDMPWSEEIALRAFADQTGRDAPYDSEVICRDHVQNRGVDILMTNYVMLELILTRWEDRNVFPLSQLGQLEFLVLDEIHTYTGRKGADVACLIRRLKEHTGTSSSLRCIGTSATVDSSAGDEGGRRTIAAFAHELFGEPFNQDDVITERYSDPLTTEVPNSLPPSVGVDVSLLERLNADDADAIRQAAEALTGKANPDAEDLRSQGTIAFLERSCTAAPRAWGELVSDYRVSHRSEASLAEAGSELEAALIVGNAYGVEVEGELVPFLIPKVHSFISQGRPITSCLAGHLSDKGETVCGTCDGEVPSFPVVFCNACGAEAYSATRREVEDGPAFEPAEFNSSDVEGEPGYMFPGGWDPIAAPTDERRLKKDGAARKGWKGAVPENLRLSREAALSQDTEGIKVAWVSRPMFLCPACGVQYTRRQNEYQKFFLAGLVGRATATDVLLGEMLQRLPAEPKRSLIAFADNIQDAAFQAAHANDFQRRLHFRRALYTALCELGALDDATKAVPVRKIGTHVFEAMKTAGSLPRYSRVPDVTVGAAAGASEKDYKRYLTFGVMADLVGRTRWRNNQTLHDVAALDVVYSGLGELSNDDAAWADIKPMASAIPDLRADTLHGILDIVRIAGAINSEYLNKGDEFRDDVISRLPDEAQFHEPSLPPYRPTVFSDEIVVSHETERSVRRFTFHESVPRDQGLVRWVRTLHPALHDRDDAKTFIQAVVGVLATRNLLLETIVKGSACFQLHEDAVRVVARSGGIGRWCPRCHTRWQLTTSRPCPQCAIPTLQTIEHDWSEDYVRHEYLTPIGARVMLLAEEHTSRVPGGERKEIETRFKAPDDSLNTLVCTPTMELGIDIGGLSGVYMRNVPPSPANYAQRQGRSGRHGQPAFVATFCGTAGKFASHDQYFYRFPDRIVAGRIAPPRFLLENEDLLLAHLNSLALEYLNFKILSRPMEFIDFDQDDVPFLADVVNELRLKVKTYGSSVVNHAWNALGAELKEVGRDRTWIEARVEQFPDRYRDAWRGLIDEFTIIRAEARDIAKRQEAGDVSKESAIRRSSILSRMKDMREGSGDFYPYRYLGSQGFLPNYAFPRRASSIFFNDRKEAAARHRVIALREFAPEASVYYRGSRYRVERAQPRSRGGETNWTRFKRCVCGTFYAGNQVSTSAVCHNCGADLTSTFAHELALEIPDVVGRKRGRISSDEEERRRRGYEIEPSYQLPPAALTGALSVEDEQIAAITYAHQGRLLVTNLGLRSPKGEPEGFRMCERCRKWILSEAEEDEHINEDNPKGSCPAGGDIDDIRKGIVLFAEATHDMIILDVAPPSGQDPTMFATSLLHAFLDGFEIAFSTDESEIAGYVFLTGPGERRMRLLLYEKEEGGVGLLRNLVTADGWKRVAIKALELLHVDPVTGHESPDACVKACYDCLLSFYNQFEHALLDRNLAIPFLRNLTDGFALDLTGPAEKWKELHEAGASGAERQVIEELQRRNCPPPTGQHEVIRTAEDIPVAEADLTYPGKIVVLVDGDPHKWEHIKRHDVAQRQTLKALGYKVVVIDMEDPEPGYRDLMERLGVSIPEAVAESVVAASLPEAVGPGLQLPSVAVRSREEVDPYNGWVPLYELGDGRPGAAGSEAGWISCGELPVEEGWYAIRVPGRSLSPQVPPGGVVLVEPLNDEAPQVGETVLIDLGDQIDPDTATSFALRQWWPKQDETGHVVGLELRGRPSSGVAPLEPDRLDVVNVVGRFASHLEEVSE